MRSDPLWSLALAAAFAAACSEPAPPAGAVPASLSVAPSIGYAGDAVPVVISGTGFLAKATQPQGGGEPALDTQTRAWLGSTELSGVTWLGTTTLNATVPAGLAPGKYDLTVENALGNLGTAKDAYTALAAAPFSATATVDHATVNVGQSLTLTVTVTNGGSHAITGLQLGVPMVSSSDGGSARPLSAQPPAPSAIAPGERQTFTWTYAPTTAGHVSITVGLAGVDATSGAAVTAALAAPAEALIQLPAALTAAWIGPPSSQTVDSPVSLTLDLANAAGAATANVTAVTPSMSPGANVSCTAAAPAPTAAVPVQIAGGAWQRFAWSCTASTFGDYAFGAAVAANDLNTGGPVPVLPPAVTVNYTTDLVLTVVLPGNGSGTVTSTPAGITGCGPVGGTCSALFPRGTLVTLDAAPATGSTLGWAGCTPTPGKPNQCTVTIDGAKKVTATFTSSTHTVGGSVTGLAGAGLTLQDNGGDDLAIDSNGTFAFKTPIASGGAYAVTVKTQPSSPSQTCTVTRGSGPMPSANVTNVSVSCVTNAFTVGGSVSGLAGSGLTLQDNGRDDLAVAANGTFVFKTPIASGGAYAVTVKTQPSSPSQTCAVTNGSGVMSSANVTSVNVSCVTGTHTVGGSVKGLAGAGLTLQDNGADDLGVALNGAFAFKTPIASGAAYAVTVKTQPSSPSQTCTVTSGSGVMSNANVTSVNVSCVTNTFTVGGLVSGLAGPGLKLQDNGRDDLAVASNGTFVFKTPIASGAGYAVTVKTQPKSPKQTCTVTNGSGVVPNASVTNVAVTCG